MIAKTTSMQLMKDSEVKREEDVSINYLLRTYNDKEDEIDEVVKGMCIHDIIHDIHPSL